MPVAVAIAGYEIGEVLFESAQSLVLRGIQKKNGAKVVIKTLNSEYPSNQDVARIRREFRIAKRLAHIEGGIEVYALETYGNGNVAITMEPFDQSLADLIQMRGDDPLPINRFLKFAIRLATTIGIMHQHDIVHKDVNPHNILIDPDTDEIRLIDFGIGSELSRERQDLNVSKRLEGSLPFISPEQTGRMNRDLDYRSDSYSLGVTLYELFTGYLPFEANNTLEWVRCHISQAPPVPGHPDAASTGPLPQIILKLLSKSAEDRYQSSYGLTADLEACRKQLDEQGAIKDFPLARMDVSERFQIPQVLYGRENEIAVLKRHFDKVAAGATEMCLVSGYSGVGKSALVNEINKPLVRTRGYFLQGKFDQFQRDKPYSAISAAFRSLVHQLLAESRERLEFWRRSLQDALGSSAQVILEVVPELEKIIGSQPAAPALPPTEAQNRFQIIFQKFVKVLAQADHPLVVFLDDLQWSDAPTLRLLKKLMTAREITHLFVIGAYRSNEVDRGHPLLLTCDEIRKVKEICDLPLSPLDQSSVTQIVADTLLAESKESEALGALLFQKTEGNPFFVKELLKNLHEEGYVTFRGETGKWVWDMADVLNAEISNSVVEFMIGNLKKLPTETQQVLQLASCIGNTFDLRTFCDLRTFNGRHQRNTYGCASQQHNCSIG